MQHKILRIIFSCVILFCGNLPYVFAMDDLTFLKSLKDRVPEKDALDAIRAGRIKFLGIGGYASSVPGIDDKHCFVDRNFVDMIAGTDDVISSDTDPKLLKIAREYAYKYNVVIKGEFAGKPQAYCLRNK